MHAATVNVWVPSASVDSVCEALLSAPALVPQSNAAVLAPVLTVQRKRTPLRSDLKSNFGVFL